MQTILESRDELGIVVTIQQFSAWTYQIAIPQILFFAPSLIFQEIYVAPTLISPTPQRASHQ